MQPPSTADPAPTQPLPGHQLHLTPSAMQPSQLDVDEQSTRVAQRPEVGSQKPLLQWVRTS